MSVEVSITVSGMEELRRKINKLNSELKRKVNDELRKIGSLISERAKNLAPIRTGRLRSSIFSRVEDWTLKVGANAPYARYVEFGTRWIKPRHFMLRAVQENTSKIKGLLDKAVSSAISEVST